MLRVFFFYIRAAMTKEQRLSDRKREAIIHAAITEFRDSGFTAASMDRIAARAEVSKRTVYNHFPSKDELFAEILEQLWANSLEQFELPYRSDQPLRDQLLRLMQLKMRMLNDASFMDLARVAIAEMIHSPDRARAMVAKLGEREEGVSVWVRAAQADGKLMTGANAALAASQLQALVKAFAFWPQITLGQPPLSPDMQEQVIHSTVDLFLARYEVKDKRCSVEA